MVSTLKKDPSPGGPTTDGTTIYTDQHNAIVDRLGGETALTADRAIATDANGDLEVQTTTKTEIGYVNGVTSAIQTQLDAKAASSHTHLEADITDLQSYLLNVSEDTTPQLGGTLDGQSNSITNVTIDDSAGSDIHANIQHVRVFNTSGATISIGDAVYITGYNAGQDLPNVELADASGTGTMPAVGIMEETIDTGNAGDCVVAGRVLGFDTSGFTANQTVYVSNVGTTTNTLTTTKPTGTDLIQAIGIVLRSHATLGVIEVIGAGRTNDLPNNPTVVGRLEQAKGADVASANDITLGNDGNTFDITGTTTINTIAGTDWQAGSVVSLQFDGILTVTHNSGGANDILLGDQSNMTTAAGDVLTLFFNGTDWVEISRSTVGGGGGDTVVGTQVMYVDSSAFAIAGATPSSLVTKGPYGANSQYVRALQLSDGSDQEFYWQGVLDNWNAGTIKVKAHWFVENDIATPESTTFELDIAGVSLGNFDSLGGTAYPAVVTLTDTTDATAAEDKINISAASSNITITNAAEGEWLSLKFVRTASTDTAGIVYLAGISIEYTIASGTATI